MAKILKLGGRELKWEFHSMDLYFQKQVVFSLAKGQRMLSVGDRLELVNEDGKRYRLEVVRGGRGGVGSRPVYAASVEPIPEEEPSG